MKNAKKYLQIPLIILIVATILFIFGNSMMPPDVSGEQSNTVAGIIGNLIPPDTDLGSFIQQYIRKIAHFTEYGLLGVELAIYVILYAENKLRCASFNMLTPLVVGFLDETIQFFSGRAPAIADVWIDIGGFAFFSIIVYLIYNVIFAFMGAFGSGK